MKTFFAMLLLMAASLQVTAQEREGTVIAVFEMKGTPVSIYRLGEVQASTADTPSMDAFAAKVGEELRTFTAANGVEGCATICKAKDGSAWGAVLTSIYSQAACPRTSACPKGMEETSEDIHSHLHQLTYEPTELDKLFLYRQYKAGQKVGTDPNYFSEGDFEGGHGYMVSKTRLMHQAGPRRIRQVKD